MVTPPQIPGLSDWHPQAKGGFATVWTAKQESLNRLVAVKVDQRVLDTDGERRRFLREAGAAGRMSGHPGIVTVHDAGLLADGRPYLVMEFCPNGSLHRWVVAEERMPTGRVREIGVRIADALAASHSRGVLHRDVKPPNILIDAYGHAGLADFGLAALPDPGMELSEKLEAITPAYAPPEVFGTAALTEYADVYSLAATLYAVLAGAPPRAAGDVEAALAQLQEPIRVIPGVDPELMTVLLGAMADDPAARPTAAQFRDQLAALSLAPPPVAAGSGDVGSPVETPPSDGPDGPEGLDGPGGSASVPAAGPTSSHRWLREAVIAGVGALVVMAIIISITVATRRDAAPAPAEPPARGSAVPTTVLTPTPSSTPVAVPVGFEDCADELGPGALCPRAPECFGGLTSVANSPNIATPATCSKTHIYQTFAAGRLAEPVLRQSALDKSADVRRLCRRRVVNSLLPKGERRKDWEVFALPPQDTREQVFRCIFGRGERSGPVDLG